MLSLYRIGRMGFWGVKWFVQSSSIADPGIHLLNSCSEPALSYSYTGDWDRNFQWVTSPFSSKCAFSEPLLGMSKYWGKIRCCNVSNEGQIKKHQKPLTFCFCHRISAALSKRLVWLCHQWVTTFISISSFIL